MSSVRRATGWGLRAAAALVVLAAAASPVFSRYGLLLAFFVIAGSLAAAPLTFSRRDAVSVLIVMLACLFLIPENLVVVGPLRSVGQPAQLIGLIGLALWLAGRIQGTVRARPGHPGRWALYFFALTTMTAIVAGLDRTLTGDEASSLNRTAFVVISAIGICILAMDGIESRERLDTLLQWLVVIAGVAAFLGILEFAFSGFQYANVFHVPGLTAHTEIGVDERSGFVRIAGAAAHPIEYAVALAAIAPLALHYALHGGRRAVRQRSAIAFIAIMAVDPMSVSRAGLMTLVVALGFYFFALAPRAQFNFFVMGLVGAAAFRAAVPGLLGTLRNLVFIGEQDTSIASRTDDYAHIPGLLAGRWPFGRGLGTFVPTQYFFLDNQYLGSLLEGGIVAVAAFAALGVTGICLARGARHRSADVETRGLGQALAGGIAGLMAAAAAFDEMSFRQSAFLLFLFVGCAGALWSFVHDQPKRHPNGELRADTSGAPTTVAEPVCEPDSEREPTVARLTPVRHGADG